MGTITFTIVGDGTVGTKTKAYTLSNADINRLIAWATVVYATPPTVEVPSPPALTIAQALVAWADSVIAGTKNNVVRYEKNVAVTAVADPTPLVSS
jgi:hypothetical protein